jgi:tryptophanyl-tRNA synthetase
MKKSIEIITGIRPTGALTVANYLGAVKPIVELQNQGRRALVFVADLHALTDHEPGVVRRFTEEVVADYIALGLDPERTPIFVQSEIAREIGFLTLLLSRHTTAAELLRQPTLKDKLKTGARPETASALLLLYPVMMAADILIQRAKEVPVGEDQLAHLEIARELARRFNKRYGRVFPLPRAYQIKSYRILSLQGEGKMSKSVPAGAIFLTDSPAAAAAKIKKAQTATEGVISEKLESHALLMKELAAREEASREVNELLKQHMKGERVMSRFKQLMAEVVGEFLKDFQARRAEIDRKPGFIQDVLKNGAAVAKAGAEETMALVKEALKLK